MGKLLCVLSILIATVLFPLYVSATIQIPDKLINDGEIYYLHSYYLDDFFEKKPDRKPSFGFPSTNLWRGYVATFGIENNQLYLVDIEVKDNNAEGPEVWRSILKEVFPDSDKVKADWFTGVLWAATDRKEKRSFTAEYKYYSVFEIDCGNIIKEKNLNNRGYKKFKKQQFKAFEKTDEYKKSIEDLKRKDSIATKEYEEYVRLLEIDNPPIPIGKSSPLSNKQAKEIIKYRIFDFMTKFIE